MVGNDDSSEEEDGIPGDREENKDIYDVLGM